MALSMNKIDFAQRRGVNTNFTSINSGKRDQLSVQKPIAIKRLKISS